jgi:hypothetical protein
VVFLTQKATSHDTCMCEVAFCGFIYYNVQYVMSIVAYISHQNYNLTLSYGTNYKLWHILCLFNMCHNLMSNCNFDVIQCFFSFELWQLRKKGSSKEGTKGLFRNKWPQVATL